MNIIESCRNDALFRRDIDYIKQNYPQICKFSGKTVLITGAGGFIGSALVKTLITLNDVFREHCTVIALVRNADKVRALLGENEDLIYSETDLNQIPDIASEVDYIIHCACITDSLSFANRPVETIDSIIFPTKNILEFGVKKNARKVVYLSSMEIYGTKSFGAGIIQENDYGYIDILNTRSSYPVGKIMAEAMCMAYCREKELPVSIARLGQTIGGGIKPDDQRMFAQFARAAADGKDIILHTKGETVRSYCYLADAVSALLLITSDGACGEAYNVVNSEMTMSVHEIAELIAADHGINVRYEIDSGNTHGYLPAFEMKLDNSKLRLLGWKPATGMREAFDSAIESIKGH